MYHRSSLTDLRISTTDTSDIYLSLAKCGRSLKSGSKWIDVTYTYNGVNDRITKSNPVHCNRDKTFNSQQMPSMRTFLMPLIRLFVGEFLSKKCETYSP